MRLFYKKIKIHIFNLNGDHDEYSSRSNVETRIPLHKTAYFKYSPHYSEVKVYQNTPDILN